MSDVRPACRQCGRAFNPGRTGLKAVLCWPCFADGEVRAAHGAVRRGVQGDGRPPREPTHHRPGTEGKIQVMAERAARGESCFHPDDAKYGSTKEDD